MKKHDCIARAIHYASEAARAAAEETALGKRYGYADPACVAAGWRAHEFEQEAALFDWMAGLDDESRARALHQIKALVD